MHLSKTQIDLYHRRALPPAELLAVDDHLRVCAACRAELARGEPLDAAAAAWSSLLDGAQPDAPSSRRRRRRPRRRTI